MDRRRHPQGLLQDTLNARLMNVPVTGNARRESYAHSFDESGDCSTEVQEQFQKNIDAFEQATWSQPFQVLVESGISLSAPDELADAELHAKLWEAINALALMGAYLEHTDHLSDRELALTRASGVAQKCLCCMSE